MRFFNANTHASPDSEENQELHTPSCVTWRALGLVAPAWVWLASFHFPLEVLSRTLISLRSPEREAAYLAEVIQSRYAGWSGVDLALLFRRLDKDVDVGWESGHVGLYGS